MHDMQVSDFEPPNGVDLAEFLAPRVRVFSGISDHRNVSDLVGAGTAQNQSVRGPRDRPPHRFTAVVVVMWVGDQDSVSVEVRREIIAYPNAARVRIDENLLSRRGGDAETGVRNVLDGYGAIFSRGILGASTNGHECNDHEGCQ